MPHARISTAVDVAQQASAASRRRARARCRRTPSSVSATARGCSKISFCMKCRYGPSSTAPALRARRPPSRSTRCPCGIVDRVAFGAHVGDVAFLEIGDAARDRHAAPQRRRRGSGRPSPMPTTQRAALPRADDASGLARRDHRDRIRALEFRHCELHRAQQIALRGAVPVRVHQVRDRPRCRSAC